MAETKPSTTRRLNWRAVAALAALILVLGGAALALHLTRPGRIGGEAARQVEQLVAEGRPDLALRHLGRYLQRHPDDPPMRFLQARLLADRALAGSAADIGTLGHVAGLHQRLLRQYPSHPEADAVRARLAELYIRLSDAYRLGFDYLGDPEQGAFESRYRAAAQIARELIARRGDDPRAHGLLARAQEGLAGPGEPAELQGAIASYERALALYEAALRRDPDDAEAAEGAAEVADRLARLHRDRRDDPEAAEAALARLVAARPGAVEPRLVRYRHYREARDERRAAAELEEALRIAPEDPTVLLAAADHELHRGDPAAARARLAAIPEEDRRVDPLQRRLISGLVEYAERHPLQAMEQWREGLVLVRGAHAEMTWWLAYVHILEGRLGDAAPLIDQYRRLTGGDGPRLQLLLALREERLGNRLAAVRILEGLRQDSRIAGPIRHEAMLALGRCHEALGDREQAERIYRLAAQDDPRSTSAVASHARLLLRAGRFEEAARLLEGALQGRAPGDPDLLSLLVRVRLREQGALPPSRRSWAAFDRAAAQAAEVMPDSIELALMLADRNALAGRPDEADAQIEAALRRSPADPRIWVTSAELLFNRGRPDEALRRLERGREAAGDDALIRLMEAQILVSLGRGREAQRRLIEGSERLSPAQQADLWEALGRLRIAQADFDGADQAFETWAGLRPGAPGPILARIEVALLGGRIGEAEALLGRLEGKDDLPYRLARASILLRQADQVDGPEADRRRRRASTLNAALETAEGVVADARDLAEAHLLTGRILEALGKLNEAAASYRQAWQRGDSAALPPLTDLLARLGRFDELEQMAASSVGTDWGLGRLSARALLEAGEVDRAARLLDSAADDPNAPAAANAWRARMLTLAGRLDELENLLRREAERAAPDDPTPWVDLIAAQARLGRDRAALEVTVRQALDHASRVPAALLEARLRWAAGDAQAADEALEAALDGPIADPALVIGAASYYQETGRPDRAEPLLERLIAMQGVGTGAALQLAILLAERAAGDPAAWERAMQLVGPAGDDPARRLAGAVVLAHAPDPARRTEAIPLLEGLLADLPAPHPRAVEARDQLARLLIELGQADRAAQVTAISASQPAPSPEAIALHVRALMRAGRLAEAGSELDRLELIRPGDAEVAELRAERLLKADGGDPGALERAVADRLGSPGVDLFARAACLQLLAVGTPEAVEAASRIAGPLGERSPGRRWILGVVEAIRGRPAEALQHCAAAAPTLDFTDRIDRLGLSDAVVMAVKLAPDPDRDAALGRARPILEAMLRRQPGDPDLLLASALLSHLAADYAAEADLYRQVLRRRPGDPLALHNLALVLSEGLDRPDEALKQIDLLAARVGPLPGVLGTRGVILTRLGRIDEAIRDLSRAIELEPSADRYYYLARAYHKAGRDDQFRVQLEQARRAGLTADLIDEWQHDELRQLLAF